MAVITMDQNLFRPSATFCGQIIFLQSVDEDEKSLGCGCAALEEMRTMSLSVNVVKILRKCLVAMFDGQMIVPGTQSSSYAPIRGLCGEGARLTQGSARTSLHHACGVTRLGSPHPGLHVTESPEYACM